MHHIQPANWKPSVQGHWITYLIPCYRCKLLENVCRDLVITEYFSMDQVFCFAVFCSVLFCFDKCNLLLKILVQMHIYFPPRNYNDTMEFSKKCKTVFFTVKIFQYFRVALSKSQDLIAYWVLQYWIQIVLRFLKIKSWPFWVFGILLHYLSSSRTLN